MDVTLPYNDAKVAARLCKGGAVKYEVREEFGLSRRWIGENVAPLIGEFMSESVGETLGVALLWAAYDDELHTILPQEMHDGIHERVGSAGGVVRDGENPVQKVRLCVSGNEGDLYISTIRPARAAGGGGEQGGGNGGGVRQGQVEVESTGVNESITAIQHHLSNLEVIVVESLTEATNFRHETRRSILKIQRAVQRLAMAPGRIVGRVSGTSGGGVQNPTVVAEEDRGPTAALSKTPRDLYILWREYEEGLRGRKAAKYFTACERGRCKATYYRRKVVWDTIATLVRAGQTSNVAVDLIYQCYGRSESVTSIIGAMLRDRRNHGGHPNLRVGSGPVARRGRYV